jgi:hypothetical protein
MSNFENQEPIEEQNNNIEDKSEENSTDSELWDEIGFHRPLAGFWYKMGFVFIHIIGGIVVAALIYPIMFPYPECDGYYRTATSIFVALFIAFDLGTANLMNRFLGESGIKNPEKMIQYLQYFIWYQMFSGLFQVTTIAIWALYLPQQDLIYLTWIFLLYSTTQYPAMQSVFRNALAALQQFDKSSILSFLEGDVIQKLSEIMFVLLFRYTLGQNPQYKIILAISMGLVLGKYLDDYLVMFIGMKFFNSSLKKYGISARVCFRHDFDWKIVKECLIFGIKTGLPGVISGFVGLIVLLWWLDVPQYTSFVALFALAASIVNFISGMQLDLGGAISESFLNNKKKLAEYYIGQTWRFDAIIQILLYSIIYVVILVLKPTLILMGMENYLLAIPFIFPIMVRRFFEPYKNLGAGIMTSTNHPNINFILSMITLAINLVVWWLLLVVYKIPQNHGMDWIVWIMPAGDLIGVLFQLTATYIILNRNIIKIRVPLWQTFGAPGLAALILIICGTLFFQFVFIPIELAYGTIVALIPTVIVFVILFPFYIYMPLTAFFGAWDDGSIESFKKAASMSGFAKLFVSPMYKSLAWSIPKAKLHNRFSVDDKEALIEARELMIIKQNRKNLIEKN